MMEETDKHHAYGRGNKLSIRRLTSLLFPWLPGVTRLPPVVIRRPEGGALVPVGGG